QYLAAFNVHSSSDFFDFGFGFGAGLHAYIAGEHGGGFHVAATLNEIARGFRQAQDQQAIDYGRNDQREVHPAPGGQAEQADGIRGAHDEDEQGADEEGHEDAQHDGHLLHGAQAPAIGCRGNFGDVGRGDYRGEAHADAADNAPEDQVRNAEAQPAAQGRDEQQHRCNEHGAHAAHAFGDDA